MRDEGRMGDGERTQSNIVSGAATPGRGIMILDSFPDVPAAKVINIGAAFIFNLVPFQNGLSDQLCQTWYIEHCPKIDCGLVTPYMGGNKWRDDGDAVGDEGKIDEVSLGK